MQGGEGETTRMGKWEVGDGFGGIAKYVLTLMTVYLESCARRIMGEISHFHSNTGFFRTCILFILIVRSADCLGLCVFWMLESLQCGSTSMTTFLIPMSICKCIEFVDPQHPDL